MEKQKQLNRLMISHTLRLLLCGAHHGLMLFVMNFILAFANITLLNQSPLLLFVGSLAVAIFVIRRMNKVLLKHREDFLQQHKKITEQ